MGNRKSVFTPEQLEEYQDATYFTRKDILRAQKRFRELSPVTIPATMTGCEAQTIALPLEVMETLPELKENPFKKRLCQVFSKNNSGALTFDDFLDMMSVLSEASPRQIRVAYAFRMFDYDGDGFLGWSDMEKSCNHLTATALEPNEVRIIVGKILEEGDIDDDGKLSFVEFQHIIERTPDFMTNFHVRI